MFMLCMQEAAKCKVLVEIEYSGKRYFTSHSNLMVPPSARAAPARFYKPSSRHLQQFENGMMGYLAVRVPIV